MKKNAHLAIMSMCTYYPETRGATIDTEQGDEGKWTFINNVYM